ncbi:hypothetical protein LSPH24S_01324 [Lysinibacillus sphaericus]
MRIVGDFREEFFEKYGFNAQGMPKKLLKLEWRLAKIYLL